MAGCWRRNSRGSPGKTLGSPVDLVVKARTGEEVEAVLRELQALGGGATEAGSEAIHCRVPSGQVRKLADSELVAEIRPAHTRCTDRFFGRRTNGNNDSPVVLVKYGAAKFLFTGDAEAEHDARCVAGPTHLMRKYSDNKLLNVDVLKVSHHGSFNGTTPERMQATTPQISIIVLRPPARACREPDRA